MGCKVWIVGVFLGAMKLSMAAAQLLPLPQEFIRQQPSDDARYVAQWALDTADARGRPFVVVDKKEARVFVFNAQGQLAGASAALLGATRGDESAPGVGLRTQLREVATNERTTPAGRFVTMPGRNLEGEAVVWVDYGAAFAIHRLRPGAAHERRQARLDSPTPLDNRVSLGCVVVTVAFFENVVMAHLGFQRGVVYVLPETMPVQQVFGALLSAD